MKHTITVIAALLLAPLAEAQVPVVFKVSEGVRPNAIVALDLLSVKEPKTDCEARLRVIKLTTRAGAAGYGDFMDYGLPAEETEASLARMVNRYAAQDFKKDIFLTDPSMRALGGGHAVLGRTALEVLDAKPESGQGEALFARPGFGPMWMGPGRDTLIIALQSALLDLAAKKGDGRVRVCVSIPVDRDDKGKRRLCTPDEFEAVVATIKQAGFTAVRLELAGALDDEMSSRGHCTPYRYPARILSLIDKLVASAKKAAGPDMAVVVAANANMCTDGMTALALCCARRQVYMLENPMALRHLAAQGEARKEFELPLGFGGDYETIEDFSQGIRLGAGTILTPDAGNIGGVVMLVETADRAKAAGFKIAPHVNGGPLSLMTVVQAVSGRNEVLWISASGLLDWLKTDGVLKIPMKLERGCLVAGECGIDESKFRVKRIVDMAAKGGAK